MKISDLNYVETIETSEILGGRGSYDFNRKKNLKIDIKENVKIRKDLFTDSVVYGNSALAEADSEAYGANSNAEAFSFTFTDDYASAASATSVSQSDGAYSHYKH